MAERIVKSLPTEQMRRLDFLLGEGSGQETLYPPGGPPVEFEATVCCSREECERFLRCEFYAEIPGLGIETFLALITYSEKMHCYRLWAFAASQEEPLHMTGNFEDDGRLVFISDPTPMVWGLQRMRSVFKPLEGGAVEYTADLWEPEGYVKYCSVVFTPAEQA
jgi:hypothetical protein